ncbi:MAG: hypothetical protein HC897_08145 [Thermoanaerobaculia bacterium]|nr:hypothetical protein [Thermoanaerobaculia bacterium]
MLELTLLNPDFWKYASIPLVAGVVGWWTNWVAIEMTFRPLEFRGIRPWLGWQGIIPSKAVKMASIFVDSTMYRLGTLRELFDQMDPARMAEHIASVMDRRVETYTDEVMFLTHGRLWRNLPTLVKERIYASVRGEMPGLIDALMNDVGEQVEQLVDFKHMIVGQLSANKGLLNRLFLESGKTEFKFIIDSGFYFGFLFGLAQLVVWFFYKGWWVLPVFGLIVGYATNWLALNLVFRPLHPRKIGPFIVHGLFLRRQKEVAQVWCRLVTREMITVRQIIDEMLSGPNAERAHALIRKHVRKVADEALGSSLPVAGLTLGMSGLEQIREKLADKAIKVSIEPFNHWPFNEERGVIIERMLRERMESLPPEEFQDLLRPCFQEDEMKLILLGGVLGFAAGLAQLFLVFGGVQ